MMLFAFGTPRKEPVLDLRKISISTRYTSFLFQFNVKYFLVIYRERRA